MQASVGLELISSSWTHSIHSHKSSISSQPTLAEDDRHNRSSSSLSDLEDESEPPVEYSDAPVHAEGVPQSNTKLFAKNYRTREFCDSLFELLRSQLKLPGWSTLSDQHKPSITISKVSGSLTNAVFFVSCPPPDPASQPQSNTQLPHQTSPPTVLLRIYGPSSGTLISRKEELHLLHTLSAKYGIGPLLLGTFDNGRVEQFFKSRPLTKEEVRDPQISTWIARKMSELHSVDLSTVIDSDHDPRNQSQSSCRANSLSSDSKWMPAAINSPSMNHSASPLTTPQLRSLNYSNSTREGQKSLSMAVGSKSAKAGVWNNITRWQHEATKVFVDITKALEKLGIQPLLPTTDEEEDPLERFRATPFPLSSPQALAEFVKIVDLPRLILEMKAYRAWIYNHERINGKSPRIFSHNDTQCGNLLLRQDDDPLLREQPQDQIMVIDFEYASANPRGFDIANHFHEWCADYHHPTHSYSLTRHGNYPTYPERKRFYRAYLGIDCEYSKTNSTVKEEDPSESSPKSYIKRFKDCEISELNLDEPSDLATPTKASFVSKGGHGGIVEKEEDGEVTSLEQDVSLWSPASHAMWALWGLVQARDDLKVQLDRWLSLPTLSLANPSTDEFEFDYFSYSAERIILFRRLLAQLAPPLVV
ncbi:hypothetical protein PTTG_06511 [Puccinia triticina 1-1 BBBD Race 1]|uniref:Choline kinase N-terminal domain-containing protein n=2 Tax=Puccinia triticina TaxID=208348 RepID=A0A180GFZ7_PUCT1|nr:uncharacterized protein PtA15_5A919 [Puccinia triticina]OAV91667.1 hypothetical protein PTTG_06511 [Puccinia triticina 1-1 BBBD Race 1]WAQ85344.1 hypothetical protein PtA15_5A919 [Puccinia triticina]WAR58633.1 hypothetical protein PtB15_5B868 [Puccinia triticina]